MYLFFCDFGIVVFVLTQCKVQSETPGPANVNTQTPREWGRANY